MYSDYDFCVIKMLRKKHGLTLEALAELAGLTYSTVAGIEENKASPSLRTLDAIAHALQLATANLLNLAERTVIRVRNAQVPQHVWTGDQRPRTGLENCRVASYESAKLIRVIAQANRPVRVMAIHEDCYEFCYILSGRMTLEVGSHVQELKANQTALFDALLDHKYTPLEDCEWITIHVPKSAGVLASLLGSAHASPQTPMAVA